MSAAFFFKRGQGLTVREIAALTGAHPQPGVDLDRRINGVAPLDRATPYDLVFLENGKHVAQAEVTLAGVCLTIDRLVGHLPAHTSVLSVRAPYRAFVDVSTALFPEAQRPSSLFEAAGISTDASIHPSARLENGVTVEPRAVIGPRAEIGSGTVIGPGAVIGPNVCIGRDCSIGANATIIHTFIGDRVIVHPGCSFGQDGFGFEMGARGHRKVPQVGRVIIQDDVEIGAGTTIDRGAIRDTVIGEGTKVDNLVQVGHNVSVGRHCVIVGQTGISGSATLEDFVVLGARVGVGNHVTIGEGSQLAALAIVLDDVPAGARWGGAPAKPIRMWARELYAVKRLAEREEATRRASGEQREQK